MKYINKFFFYLNFYSINYIHERQFWNGGCNFTVLLCNVALQCFWRQHNTLISCHNYRKVGIRVKNTSGFIFFTNAFWYFSFNLVNSRTHSLICNCDYKLHFRFTFSSFINFYTCETSLQITNIKTFQL